MKVSNFSISPAMFVPGDEVLLAFSVKAESGDTLGSDGLILWLSIPGYGEIPAYRNPAFTIAAGQTKTLNVKTALSFANRSVVRGETVSRFGVQLGYYGSRTDVSFPLTLLDAWYRPSIPAFEAERATQSQPDDEGENLRMRIRLGSSSSAPAGAMQLNLTCRSSAAPEIAVNLDERIESALNAELQTTLLQTLNKNSDWQLTLRFGDAYESAEAVFSLSRAFANVHLSGASTGGVCFGSFSRATEGNPLFQCYYPAEFPGGIQGVTDHCADEIPTGGRWIDGRRIYRRVISFSVSAKNTKTGVADLGEIASLVELRGYMHRSDGPLLPLSFWYNDNDYNSVWVEDALLMVKTSHAVTGCAVIEYTKSNEEVG